MPAQPRSAQPLATPVAPRVRSRLDPQERQSLILDNAAGIIAREGVSALSMELESLPLRPPAPTPDLNQENPR